MIRVTRPPSQSGYTVEIRSAAIERELRGGLSRSRRDISRPSYLASVSYTVSAAEAEGFEALYDRLALTGEAFLADLLIEEFALTTYQCLMVPGSFQLQHRTGGSARVGFRVDAIPSAAFTTASDEALLDIFGAYGEDAADFLAALARLVNEDLPN
jgi:hypothetical protein